MKQQDTFTAADALHHISGSLGGSKTSPAKADAARANGAKGGRPKKEEIAAACARTQHNNYNHTPVVRLKEGGWKQGGTKYRAL